MYTVSSPPTSFLPSQPLQAELSRKFKVSGIPTLVFLDGNTGKLITADGRSVVSDDKDGSGFPWVPKPLPELVAGKLINNKGEEKDFDADVKGTIFGLYFSAHWVCGVYIHMCILVHEEVVQSRR